MTGSVADRMAFFRQQAELEKKQVKKQMPVKMNTAPPAPAPTPAKIISPTPTNNNNNETKERVSLKKAPDPNKA